MFHVPLGRLEPWGLLKHEMVQMFNEDPNVRPAEDIVRPKKVGERLFPFKPALDLYDRCARVLTPSAEGHALSAPIWIAWLPLLCLLLFYVCPARGGMTERFCV